MGIDEYLAQYLMTERLRMVRDLARQRALVAAARPPRVPLRVRLGMALIRAGRLLAGGVPARARHHGA